MDEDNTTLTEEARAKLQQVVERIESLEADKQQVAGQIKDKYLEAKAMGYDVKALRKVIAIRKQDRQDREEAEAILDTYLMALGEI